MRLVVKALSGSRYQTLIDRELEGYVNLEFIRPGVLDMRIWEVSALRIDSPNEVVVYIHHKQRELSPTSLIIRVALENEDEERRVSPTGC